MKRGAWSSRVCRGWLGLRGPQGGSVFLSTVERRGEEIARTMHGRVERIGDLGKITLGKGANVWVNRESKMLST